MRERDALQHYRQQTLEFSSPGEILVKLLDGAVRNSEQARACILAKDPAGKGVAIGKALAILGELEATLRHDVAPDLARQLASLYQFSRERLMYASVNMDPDGVDEALRAIRPIRDAYAEVVAQEARKHEGKPVLPGSFKAALD